MPVLFANPWGLLALLGIPAVLAVHFLHRHRKPVPVSTLFLIEMAREPARSGRRWHRLISSVPMWLQLLLVLLLAALLAQPFLPGGVLRVAVVVDDSASMRAFRNDLADHLTDLENRTRTGGQAVQWLVMPSNPTRPRLYAGENPSEWIAGLVNWVPADGWRDPTQALRLARERVGPDGLVVYATDTPRADLAGDAALLAVGRPIENAGIGGITVGEDGPSARWQAVLVNPSAEPARRTWTLEWDGARRTPEAEVVVPANGMATLGGDLPEGATRLALRLSGDGFDLDDFFPFVRPAPKPLAMASLGGPAPEWLVERMTRAIPRLGGAPAAAADFALVGVAGQEMPPPVAGLVFSTAGGRSGPFLSDTVAATPHPLVRGLAWSALAVRDVPAPPPAPNDVVLLWAGDRPLVSLRPVPAREATAGAGEGADGGAPDTISAAPAPAGPPSGPQLVLHFNPTLSNFDRLPAAAVLLLRFTESIRDGKAATAWEQLEPGQSLATFLPSQPSGTLVIESLAADGSMRASRPLGAGARAPDEPGFLRVRDDQAVWLEAAVAFADPRESDFRQRAFSDTTEAALSRAVRQTTPRTDAARPLLLLAALAALLALYHFNAPKSGAPGGRTAGETTAGNAPAAPTTPTA